MARSHLERLFALEDRVVLVTGASGGIGRHIALGLALAGGRVAVGGRTMERIAPVVDEIVAAGGIATGFPGELKELDAIPRLVDEVNATLGPIDILVNCAGINRREPVEAVAPETYTDILDTNLRAPYFLSQAVMPDMRRRGGGKVINVGSLTSGWGVGNLSIYGMSKSAIAQMTKVMAVEWASHNIQVNCICPGWIETELTQPLWSDPAKRAWILDRIPAGRPGAPDDLVGMSVYLASPASNYTTGQVLYVDGGFMAGGQW